MTQMNPRDPREEAPAGVDSVESRGASGRWMETRRVIMSLRQRATPAGRGRPKTAQPVGSIVESVVEFLPDSTVFSDQLRVLINQLHVAASQFLRRGLASVFNQRLQLLTFALI